MNSVRSLVGLLLGGSLVAGACSGAGPAAQPSTDRVVRVLASWTGQELDEFMAVLEPFEQRTGIEIEYSSTRDLPGTIHADLDRGAPPDLAGLAGPNHLVELAHAGALRDLAPAIDLRAYKAGVAPTFIDLGTVDGRLVGVFLRTSVKGLIWYRPALHDHPTPMTWPELELTALRMGDIKPWCVGLGSRESSGWPGTDWIENFLIRQSGPDVYDAWVAGTLPWTSPEVQQAWRSFGGIVANNTVYGGVEAVIETDFEEAGDPLFTDPPGCLFHHQGSFMPTFWQRDGLTPVEDFDFFPFPEIEPAFARDVVGGGDLFGLLTDKPAARELIAYLVSREAQSRWVQAGGALSVDQQVTEYPDAVTAHAAAVIAGAHHFRFDASDLMPDAVNAAFWRGVLDYTETPARLAEVLDTIEAIRLGLDRS